MKNSTTLNRKTRRMIAKNLIILLVLAVIAFIVIWAWFTSGQSATADGINIKSKASGVEVSWNNKDFYYNLTALTDEDVVAGETGLAKNISGTENTPSPLKLVTGNGLKFFEPYLNRRLGTPLLHSDNSWQGIDIVNGEGKYIDIDLYFRSDTARDIYLAGDSFVSPKSTKERFSEYGDFSKDYICAASRVAFLNADKTDCSFIWAPNSDYELKENDNGYTRVTEYKEEEAEGGGTGGDFDGGATNDGKNYYFWTIRGDQVLTQSEQAQSVDNLQCTAFEFNADINYYVTEVSFYIPTYSNNPSIPILINNSSTKSDLDGTDTVNIKGADSMAISKEEQKFYIRNTDWQMNTASGQFNCANVMNGNEQYIKSGEYMTLTLGYNPATDILTILKYDTNSHSFDIGLDEGDPVYVKYYEIENNVTTALVAPEAGTAISSGDEIAKAVTFKSSDKINVTPISVTTSEQFTAHKTGEGATATYQFENVKSDNKYLYVSSSGKVSLASSGSDFTLVYVDGFTGPALKSGNYYIVMQNGELKGVTLDNLQIDNLFTVYTGSSYILDTASSTAQDYMYYDSALKLTQDLNGTTTPKLFATGSNTDATVKVGNTKITTLTKENEDDEFFTAHIVIRIWAEGTDRDALTPLADGIFDTSFHFVSG